MKHHYPPEAKTLHYFILKAIAAILSTLIFYGAVFAQSGSHSFEVSWYVGIPSYGGHSTIDGYIEAQADGYMRDKCRQGGSPDDEYLSHSQPNEQRYVIIKCWHGDKSERSAIPVGVHSIWAHGGDTLDSQLRCPPWERYHSTIAAAINDVISTTLACPIIGELTMDECSQLSLENIQSGGKCGYGYRKNYDMHAGYDNVGGTAEWSYGCPSGTSKEGASCYCPVGTKWLQSANGGKGACVATVDKGAPPAPHGTCGRGNPIYPLTGVKRQIEDAGVGLGFVKLALTYDTSSVSGLGGQISAFPGRVVVPGDFGSMWWNSAHRHLYINANGLALRAARGDGTILDFAKTNSQWVNGFDGRTVGQDQKDVLSILPDGYLYRDQKGMSLESYHAQGYLLSWVNLSGMKIHADYAVRTGGGYVTTLRDPFGRSLAWEQANQGILSIKDSIGQNIAPVYAAGKLTGMVWQDQTMRNFVYDSPHPDQGWALTGIMDENQKRYATFSYDAKGHAISTEHAGHVNKFSVEYSGATDGATGPKTAISEIYDANGPVIWRYSDWLVPQPPSVTWPTGGVEVFNAPDLALNYPRDVGRQQPAGAGCSAATSYQSYDTNGNLASQDDFNGHRTCYANDLSRNLEATRVEGLANTTTCSTVTAASAALPTGSRKISTAWHPDWAIKTKQAEPLKLTTWVYNGQPDPFNGNQPLYCVTPNYGASIPDNRPKLPDGKDIVVLCKQVEQSTLDADGSQGLSALVNTAQPARTFRYTYTQYGQVLTSKDARSNTTTNAYYQDTAFTGTAPNEVGHYQGDLHTVTNAKGHITTYTSYDRAGKPLSVTDPNGLVTNYAYWPRGWIKSVQVGAQVTSYTYWPTGLLKQVKNPDGSTLDYVYDDAHRLTDVTDNQGNTVHYTLDNAGNRKVEDVKDNTTALTRQIERAYDDLNRLKSVIGAAQ